MSKLTEINVVKERLAKWSAENPPLPESAVEAILLFDVFRGILEFSDKNSCRQLRPTNPQSKRAVGRTDIVLRPNANTKVVVEVKRFGALKSEAKELAAVRQTARYLRTMDQKFGIVTDAKTWIFITVMPYGPSFRVHQILRFNVETQPALAIWVFKRAKVTTMIHLFNLLSSIAIGLDLKTLKRWMQLSLSDRQKAVESLIKSRPKQETLRVFFPHAVEVTRDDKTLLKIILHSDNTVYTLSPSLAPTKLTRKS